MMTEDYPAQRDPLLACKKTGEYTSSVVQCIIWCSICFPPGGIIGLGEAEEDRVGLLHTLATFPTHPESVPINALVAVKGTPLEDQKVFRTTIFCIV